MPLYPDAMSELLNHIGGYAAWSMPSSLEVRLFTDMNGQTEVTGGSYEPQPVTLSETVSGDTEAPSQDAVTFTDMPATTVRSVGLFDGVNGLGILYKAITPINVTAGGEVAWGAAQLRVALY